MCEIATQRDRFSAKELCYSGSIAQPKKCSERTFGPLGVSAGQQLPAKNKIKPLRIRFLQCELRAIFVRNQSLATRLKVSPAFCFRRGSSAGASAEAGVHMPPFTLGVSLARHTAASPSIREVAP